MTEFKIGDRVRRTKDSPVMDKTNPRYRKGFEFTVAAIVKDKTLYDEELKPHGSRYCEHINANDPIHIKFGQSNSTIEVRLSALQIAMNRLIKRNARLERKIKRAYRSIIALEKDSHPPQPVVSPSELANTVKRLDTRIDVNQDFVLKKCVLK